MGPETRDLPVDKRLLQLRRSIQLAVSIASAQPSLACKLLIKEIRRRVFSDEILYGFEFDLEQKYPWHLQEAPIMIRELAPEDVCLLFDLKQPGLDVNELRELAVRLRCLEARLQRCYVGISPNAQPVCMCWLMQPTANGWLLGRGIKPLAPTEVLLENIWTRRDVRGKRLMQYLTLGLFAIAWRDGARRAVAYIRAGNESSLSGARAIGWRMSAIMKVRHRFFRRRTAFEPVLPHLSTHGGLPHPRAIHDQEVRKSS
jgi:hypothetical protein